MDGVWTDNSDDVTDGARDGLSMARNGDSDPVFGASAIGFAAADTNDWDAEPHEVEEALNALANGEAVPYIRCDGSRNFTAGQRWNTDKKITLRSVDFYIHSPDSNRLAISARSFMAFKIGPTPLEHTEAELKSTGLYLSEQCVAKSLRAFGSSYGTTGSVTITDGMMTPTGSTSPVICAVGGKVGPVNAIVDILFAVMGDTTKYWVPGFNDGVP